MADFANTTSKPPKRKDKKQHSNWIECTSILTSENLNSHLTLKKQGFVLISENTSKRAYVLELFTAHNKKQPAFEILVRLNNFVLNDAIFRNNFRGDIL